MRFEELEHTADLSIRAYGRSLPDLFENSALGMFSLIWHPTDAEELSHTAHVRLAPDEPAALLRRFLAELLFVHEDRALLFARFHVALPPCGPLECEAEGVPIAGHELRSHIKAVTFHRLQVCQDDNGLWTATLVFDT